MPQNTIQDIREQMPAGLTTEVNALLTAAENGLKEEERVALTTELQRRQDEANRLVAKGDALEQGGRIEEAQQAYEGARRLFADFPGIQDRITRMDEALLLARAIRRRGQRGSRAKVKTTSTHPRQRLLRIASGLTVGLAILVAIVAILRDRPSPIITIQEPPVINQEAAGPVPGLPEPETIPPASSPAAAAGTEVLQPGPDVPDAMPPQAPKVEPTPPAPIRITPRLTKLAVKGPRGAQGPYSVRPGDTLFSIAERELCDQALWQAIFRLNRDKITDPGLLRPGMQLHLEGLPSQCDRMR